VVNLERIDKKTLISSDRAKEFKSIMYDRRGTSRQTSNEKIAMIEKRKLIKKLK
jgi:hypothetical protein